MAGRAPYSGNLLQTSLRRFPEHLALVSSYVYSRAVLTGLGAKGQVNGFCQYDAQFLYGLVDVGRGDIEGVFYGREG